MRVCERELGCEDVRMGESEGGRELGCEDVRVGESEGVRERVRV